MQTRYLVAGLFETAKAYWTKGILAKVVIAILGFVVSAVPATAGALGVTVLFLEALSSIFFARSEYLKAAAEPILANLDFEDSLGWTISKDYRDEIFADFGKFVRVGKRVRAGEAYFSPEDSEIGPARLKSNILESAFYTRTLALDARNIVLGIFCLLVAAFITVLLSGGYRYFANGDRGANNAGLGAFVVDALILLVTIDLMPLAIRYNVLANEAKHTRSALAGTPSSSLSLLPTVVQYQLSRTAAPLLPTFAFLKKRLPLAAIWAKESD